jgi:hypothetical protein
VKGYIRDAHDSNDAKWLSITANKFKKMNYAQFLVLSWRNQFSKLLCGDERVSKRPAWFEQAARDCPPDGDG